MTVDMMTRVLPAIVLNAAAAIWAWRRGSVSSSGAIAGFATGGGIFAVAGAFLWSLLMVFFLSGSALSRLGATRKKNLETLHEKGGRRDAVQVLANSGVGLVTAVAYAATGHPAFAVACAVSFAAASADTWSSEIGYLSRTQPVSIVTWRPLPAGTSGGVTVLGTTAAAGGAAVIAATFCVGWILRYDSEHAAVITAVIIAAGVTGSLIDSFLGATIQARYADAGTGHHTERRQSRASGNPPVENRLIGGLRGFTNDAVNATSCLAATAIGWALTAAIL